MLREEILEEKLINELLKKNQVSIEDGKVGFIKKIIRKIFVRWYVAPIATKQNSYNQTLKEMVLYHQKLFQQLINKIDEIENNDKLINDSIVEINKNVNRVSVLADETSSITLTNNKNLKAIVEWADRTNNTIDFSTEFNLFDKTSNSQAGEDSIAAYIAAVKNIPFNQCTYLDLGANNPKSMSNTYFFYSMGAKGVLVDANPTLTEKLEVYRPKDVVLNKCIDVESGKTIEFNIINHDGLSTMDADSIENLKKENSSVEIIDKINIETISVNDILERYFEKDPFLMSIDVEGKDMEILESIDFVKHRPMLVIVEMIEYSQKLTIDKKNMQIYNYMLSQGYVEYAFTGINSIFIRKEEM